VLFDTLKLASQPAMPTVDMAVEEPSSLQHYVLLFEELGEIGGSLSGDRQGGDHSGDSLDFPDFRPSSLPTRRDSFSSLPPRRDSSGFLPTDRDSFSLLPGSLAFLRSRRDSNASLHSYPQHSVAAGGTRHVVFHHCSFYFVSFIY
jgi:hypothetical protein